MSDINLVVPTGEDGANPTRVVSCPGGVPFIPQACPPFPETLSCEGRISQARCSGMDGSATSSWGSPVMTLDSTMINAAEAEFSFKKS